MCEALSDLPDDSNRRLGTLYVSAQRTQRHLNATLEPLKTRGFAHLARILET
jgi:hypothetical protein